jgi:hypothetical protein
MWVAFSTIGSIQVVAQIFAYVTLPSRPRRWPIVRHWPTFDAAPIAFEIERSRT